ncbi:MAG: hypothetical protein HYZ16_01785 [Bacteroidetes bacterium]|jgi:membrane protein DedA with SNARE-associated domain|nr:hypothetical protein [Bacteroidota bacterium]
MRETQESKSSFLIKNLLRGFALLGLFLLVFLAAKYWGTEYINWLKPVMDSPMLVLSIYALSELLFGIITPELFMVWGLEHLKVSDHVYVWFVAMLAGMSYMAGLFNFWLGGKLAKQPRLARIITTRLVRQMGQLNRYGGFLLIVAALTPVPFAAICLLVGLSGYRLKSFILFTLFRFLRYALYGYAVWKTHSIDLDAIFDIL